MFYKLGVTILEHFREWNPILVEIIQYKYKIFQVFLYYIIDILMAVSVLAMYPLAVIPGKKHDPVNFQYWAISCLIFLQSFLLLQSYMQTINKQDDIKDVVFRDFLKMLISENNLN